MSISWKKEYSIGVAEIDQQHQQLFMQFDQFLEAIENGKGERELKETFDFLKEYVIRHFKAEENLQRRFKYPHLEMHLAEHRSFEKQLNDLFHFKGKEGELVHLTRSVLMQWLIQHICKVDTALAEFVNKHRNMEWERWLKTHF